MKSYVTYKRKYPTASNVNGFQLKLLDELSLMKPHVKCPEVVHQKTVENCISDAGLNFSAKKSFSSKLYN